MRVYPFLLYIKKMYIYIPLLLALGMNIFSWLWIITQMPETGEQVVLHYNVLFGVDYIGSLWKVYYIPTLGFFVIATNMICGWLFYKKDVFKAQLLVAIAMFIQVFIVIASLLTVYSNI